MVVFVCLGLCSLFVFLACLIVTLDYKFAFRYFGLLLFGFASLVFGLLFVVIW